MDKQNVVYVYDKIVFCFKKEGHLGCRVTQSVRRLTLDFGSGHDLRVMRSSPTWGSVLIKESA